MTKPPVMSVTAARGRRYDDPQVRTANAGGVKSFSAFLGASPLHSELRGRALAAASGLDLSTGAGVTTINHTVTALRFFFIVTLRELDVVFHLPCPGTARATKSSQAMYEGDRESRNRFGRAVGAQSRRRRQPDATASGLLVIPKD
jgi:hypothetical protein